MLAHSGHWAINLIYLVPIVAVAIFVALQSRRDRRNGRTEAADAEPPLDDVMDGRA